MNRQRTLRCRERTVMKKITKKLSLEKQTVALLGTAQLAEIIGGQKPATKQTQCADDCTWSPTQLNLC